jgi:hypothetical protein
MHTFSRLSTSAGPSSISKTQKGGIGNNGTAEKNKKNPAQHRRPIVPFGRRDRILLVGEGERFLFLLPYYFQDLLFLLMVFFLKYLERPEPFSQCCSPYLHSFHVLVRQSQASVDGSACVNLRGHSSCWLC